MSEGGADKKVSSPARVLTEERFASAGEFSALRQVKGVL